MGLFQNHKKSQKSDRDLVDSDTIDLAVHAGLWAAPIPSNQLDDEGLDEGLGEGLGADYGGVRPSAPSPSTLAHFGVTLEEATRLEEAAIDVVRADVVPEWLDEAEFARSETAPRAPAGPRRRRDLVDAIEAQPVLNQPVFDQPVFDQPVFDQWEQLDSSPEQPAWSGQSQDRRQVRAGNDLLRLLGLDEAASLAEISLAHRLFLAEHDPTVEVAEDVRKLKARMCREANTAYASYRLVMGR